MFGYLCVPNVSQAAIHVQLHSHNIRCDRTPLQMQIWRFQARAVRSAAQFAAFVGYLSSPPDTPVLAGQAF
jgi:hypothetical protein